jgi:putative ABC transport system ATP-binding protein
MIEIDRVIKTYQIGEAPLQVLSGVSLKIGQGEFVSIMGPSGSGKSTLLCLMGCLDSPTSGRVILAGQDVSSMRDADLAHVRNQIIGFVFQTYNLLPYYNALHNVILPMIYRAGDKIQGAERESRARDLLEQVGLAHRVHHRPSQLSGGERQRVAIARALVNSPKIILADEPTGNLDSRTGEEIMAILKNLNQQGVTLVVVTHDPKVASQARRTIHIADGMIRQKQTLFSVSD